MERPVTPEPSEEIISHIPNAPKKKKKAPRCHNCKKKYSLMGFKCKCEFMFCLTCKNPESHQCVYDYKHNGKIDLTMKLPKVLNKKVIII